MADRRARLAGAIGLGARGAALARRLEALGARTPADLRRPALLALLPQEGRANVLFRPCRRIRDAAALAAEMVRRLDFGASAGASSRKGARPRVEVVGSVRRGAEPAGDLDFLVVAPRAAPGLLAAARLRPPRRGDRLSLAATYAQGPRRRSLVLCAAAPGGRARCYRADLFLATAAERPFALFHYTGPASYNIRTRARAKRWGWRLNQYGLFHARSGRLVSAAAGIRSEAALARLLGLHVRAPAARR